MSTLRTTTASNLSSLGAASNIGDTYFETDNKKIVVWDGSAWTNYNNDGSAVPFSNSYSVLFDGTNDYFGTKPLSRLNSASWSTSTPVTMAAWAKVSSFSTNDGVFGSARHNSDGSRNTSFTGGSSGLHVGNNSNFYVWWNGSQYYLSGTFSANTWYHFAITWDGSNGIVYVNGSSNTTFTKTGNGYDTNFCLFAGGGGRWSAFPPCNIDELALWDSALSSSNVTTLYNSGASSDVSTLSPLAWYRMGDGTEAASGTTIYDVSGNSSADGVLFNGPTYSTDTV